ncbi:response regulator transcription factor [Homoserinibacter sp. GY 40078]|uniref:response regulator transcription factor n=1 Tax=Homoserinibacter sp. GY 40078 TaxID=2603275 RepID=UPI0011C9DB07|nr:response regulator transcription factor [Homoserinibacter sp. GY 40078]TXK18996.1 response regulator transcription factor [Homoserinibacter sp. GY 40078]
MTKRILIIDDDPLVRLALQGLLSRVPGVSVVGEAADGGSAIRVLRSQEVDIVLLDIQLQQLSGFAVAPAIRGQFPNVRIVMMTTFSPDRFEAHAAATGADGFFRKSAHAQEIIAAVLGTERRAAPARSMGPRISPRERDVGEMIAQGRSNEQIAAALGVSVNTVKTYVSRLFVKFGVVNRVQLSNAVNGVYRGGGSATGS